MAGGIKELKAGELEKLQGLEKKWGHCIVAYDTSPAPADLSPDELKEVQSLEKELGAVLVDYKC